MIPLLISTKVILWSLNSLKKSASVTSSLVLISGCKKLNILTNALPTIPNILVVKAIFNPASNTGKLSSILPGSKLLKPENIPKKVPIRPNAGNKEGK